MHGVSCEEPLNFLQEILRLLLGYVVPAIKCSTSHRRRRMVLPHFDNVPSSSKDALTAPKDTHGDRDLTTGIKIFLVMVGVNRHRRSIVLAALLSAESVWTMTYRVYCFWLKVVLLIL